MPTHYSNVRCDSPCGVSNGQPPTAYLVRARRFTSSSPHPNRKSLTVETAATPSLTGAMAADTRAHTMIICCRRAQLAELGGGLRGLRDLKYW